MYLPQHVLPRIGWRRTRASAPGVHVLGDGELDRLSAEWDRLAPRGGGPTRQFAWLKSATQAFSSISPRIFVCEEGGRLLAAAPMALRTGSAGPRLELLGITELYEPTDLRGVDEVARAAIACTLVRSRLPTRFDRIPEDSPWIDDLLRAYGGLAWVRVAPAPGAPVIRLDASWCEPESHFNPGRRSDIRRARRHAESMGPLTAEVLQPRNHVELERPLAEAFAVEMAGWKGERGSALKVDALRGEFFRRYATYTAGAGSLRLCFLRIGGRPVAMQLAVEADGGFWLLKIGYDERFGRCSPGMLLMLQTVAYAARKGLQTYELLGGPEPWTALWTSEERRCVSLRAYPFNAAGARALAHDAWCRLRRRLGERNR